MPIGEFCNREVVIAERSTPVYEAARLMRQHHVGTIVIVEQAVGTRRPVGIVTDRDIVIEVVVNNLNPETVLVAEIMGDKLATVRERDGVFEAIHLMRQKGIRRIPVVDDEGALQGIVSVDDMVGLLAEEMAELSRLIGREQAREAEIRK